MSESDALAEQIQLALSDAMTRFLELGPNAYGTREGDSIMSEESDITVWFEGRALPATGKILASSDATPRGEPCRPITPTIVINAGRGVALVYAGGEFGYAVPHPRPSFFHDLLNRELPQKDPLRHYFGWH